MFYHATFRKNIEKIKESGLKTTAEKNWEDCEEGFVYLATDPFNAESFCEVVADMIEDDELCNEDIIVLGINEEDLDLTNYQLIIDPNVIFEDGEEITSYAYTGKIPADKLYVICCEKLKEKNIGKLIDLTNIIAFS